MFASGDTLGTTISLQVIVHIIIAIIYRHSYALTIDLLQLSLSNNMLQYSLRYRYTKYYVTVSAFDLIVNVVLMINKLFEEFIICN